jgi:serine/threonine protein phosphatase PrpC
MHERRSSGPIDRVVAAVLLGTDHVRLDEVAVRPVGGQAAIALSRGRFPKGYPHVDPNEDAVLALTDGRSWLMAVADGHGGADAAMAAVTTIAAGAGDILETDPADATSAALDLADAAVREVRSGLADREPATSLTVAFIRGGLVRYAGVGDSVMMVVNGRRVRRVAGGGPFLGSGDPAPRAGSQRLGRAARVLLATDGLTVFLGHAWRDRVRTACRGTAAEAAGALVDAALDGGAGDNIAVASWLGAAPRR